MGKHNREEQLERFNLVLSLEESEWLNQLAAEIQTETGVKVSRSEIIRVALSGLRELDKLAPSCPGRFVPLHTCQTGAELGLWAVLAVRWAIREDRAGDHGSAKPINETATVVWRSPP